MNQEIQALLNYTRIRERMRRHPLRQSEIPIENTVSLPLPTLRFDGPGYAFFSSPASRRPGAPVVQGVPDRWWVLSALGAHVQIYSLASVTPVDREQAWEPVEFAQPKMTIAEMQAALMDLEGLMDSVVADFFAGVAPDPAVAAAVRRSLQQQVPAALLPQYRALAPDFFMWLEGTVQENAATEKPVSEGETPGGQS